MPGRKSILNQESRKAGNSRLDRGSGRRGDLATTPRHRKLCFRPQWSPSATNDKVHHLEMARVNQKLYQNRGDGYPVPRVYRRKARGKKSARLLIKCGDCDKKFEIHYGPDGDDLEIAGVLASVENWRTILLPLLKPLRKNDYGVTAEELDRFVKRADRQVSREREARKAKRYSGDLEADLAD